MKVTFKEEIENKWAYNPKKYCTCGAHEFDIVQQLSPLIDLPWSVRCPQCGLSTKQYMDKKSAMLAWESGNYAD